MKKRKTIKCNCEMGEGELHLMTCAVMEQDAEHTPTPWHRNVSPAWKYPIYADKNGNPDGKDWIHIAAVLPGNPNNEADLDFIVRAVNAHNDLLISAKEALCWLDPDCKLDGETPNEDRSDKENIIIGLYEAIEKAEGV